MTKNSAYGKWTEEETNWSDKDTEFLKAIEKNGTGTVPTSLKELKALHESLSY